MNESNELKSIIEALLLASDEPLSINRLQQLLADSEDEAAQGPAKDEIVAAIANLNEDYANKSFECVEVASGYRLRVKQDFAPWVAKLWELKPARYTRAFLETLALIAYKQPITRAEIEQVRGVAVSSHIIKSLLDREWIKVIGHREVPGRPAVFATTKNFLDYFQLKSLNELPDLQDIADLDKAGEQLEMQLQQEADYQNEIPNQSDDATESEEIENEIQVEVEAELESESQSEDELEAINEEV